MNLFASVTVLAPTMVVVLIADSYLRTMPQSRQLKLGGVLLCLALLPIAGSFAVIPGGTFSDAPPSLSQSLDYVLYLALCPMAGLLILSVTTITRGLWKFTARPLHDRPGNDS
jgi:hypothetical protein